MADNSKLNTAEVVIVASAAVALVASFLGWYDPGIGGSLNAWDDFIFPTYTWPALFGVAMAAVVLITTFSTARLPERILSFTWAQVHLVLAGVAVLLTVSYLIAGEEHGAGFWLTLLASIGLLVGAVMLGNEHRGAGVGPAAGPPDSAPPPPPPPGPSF